MRLLVSAYGGLLAMGLGVGGPSGARAQAPEPSAIAAAHMARDRLPSLSLAVGSGGTVAYAAAFGLADVENGVPATVGTVYRIGSVSKPITATATMQLAERGRLDLDMPVQTNCASFPDKGAGITPRLLLAHLGGIRGEEIVPHRARPYSRSENGACQKDGAGEELDYGLGWRLSDRPGEVFHGGSSVGGSAYLYLRVETGTVVALATNVDRWTEPRHELARALADWAESR